MATVQEGMGWFKQNFGAALDAALGGSLALQYGRDEWWPGARNSRAPGTMSFLLAGVISEGRLETDTIIAERADCLRADGAIRI